MKNISVKEIFVKQAAYELMCEGCESYSEWLNKNREKFLLEAEINRMYARALADMEILLMCKDKEDEIRKNLQVAIERTEKRADKLSNLKNTVAYAIVMAIYNKMLELLETNFLLEEIGQKFILYKRD